MGIYRDIRIILCSIHQIIKIMSKVDKNNQYTNKISAMLNR